MQVEIPVRSMDSFKPERAASAVSALSRLLAARNLHWIFTAVEQVYCMLYCGILYIPIIRFFMNRANIVNNKFNIKDKE